MTELTSEDTVYVTYIAAAPEKVWAALTSSEFTRDPYFFGRSVESDWKTGCAVVAAKFAADVRVDVKGR